MALSNHDLIERTLTQKFICYPAGVNSRSEYRTKFVDLAFDIISLRFALANGYGQMALSATEDFSNICSTKNNF